MAAREAACVRFRKSRSATNWSSEYGSSAAAAACPRKCAYSRADFARMVSQTPFGNAAIEEAPLGLEVWMTKGILTGHAVPMTRRSANRADRQTAEASCASSAVQA